MQHLPGRPGYAKYFLALTMKRRKYELIFLLGSVFGLAIALVGVSRIQMAVHQSEVQSLVGRWVHIDQYGRTVTWAISSDGTLQRFASDDVSDVDDYHWWVRDDELIFRLPASTADRLYRTALAWTGRAIDDDRTTLRIAALNSDSMTLTVNDGPDILLVREDVARQ